MPMSSGAVAENREGALVAMGEALGVDRVSRTDQVDGGRRRTQGRRLGQGTGAESETGNAGQQAPNRDSGMS